MILARAAIEDRQVGEIGLTLSGNGDIILGGAELFVSIISQVVIC